MNSCSANRGVCLIGCVHSSARVRSWLWERTRQLGFIVWLGLAQPVVSGSQAGASYGRRFLYVDPNARNNVHPRENSSSKAAWPFLFWGSWNKASRHSGVRGSWPHLLEAARASSVPGPCGFPYLVLTWQQQEHSSFSEGSQWSWLLCPQDPEAPKAEYTACCTGYSICWQLPQLCSWTLRRCMCFIQGLLIK